MKYIIVTGGVVSGVGKGVAAAALAKLIKENYNKKVMIIKCDGYLNTDPGTMNPTEHGEVYVMDDGGEVDMDFGHYERFLNITTKFNWNLTMGKIFKAVIDNERKGKYLGKTVQFIPHVTNEIIDRFISLPKREDVDLTIIEIGGTIGDIENMLYVEAVRQLKYKLGENNVIFAHLTYVPVLGAVGEHKSKPTQQSVHLLMSVGIHPDLILARSEEPITNKIREKIAMYTNLEDDYVFSAHDVKNIYEIPLVFKEQGMDKKIGKLLGFKDYEDKMGKWQELVDNMNHSINVKNIAIAGKYVELKDSYASVIESIRHASAHHNIKPEIVWIDTTNLQYEDLPNLFKNIDAVIVPGGFGSRGTEGKINVIRYAREKKIPLLGLCYGLQMAVVEFARNVCGLENANSTEINPETKHPVIDILPEQKDVKDMGGTMRLGSYDAIIKNDSIVSGLYKCNNVCERHRHRYEVNPEYHKILEENGLILSGKSENGRLVEFIELPKDKHPYFVATQAHPELKSRFEKPAPLFYGLIKATI